VSAERAAAVVAVDVGGTTIKGLAASTDGDVLDRLVVQTPRGGEAVYQSLVAVVEGLRKRADARGRELAAVGVASPGLVDGHAGVVHLASNLGWTDFALASRLSAQFGIAAVLENDARSGAIAERVVGSGSEDMVFVPIGTGVSAAFVVGGALAAGATSSAGEFGHVRVIENGEPCTCGSFGCVEAYASASSLLSRSQRLGGRATSTPELVTLLGVDPVADVVWADAVDALTRGLAALVTILDPQRIVLGGGLSLAGDALLEPVRRGLAAQLTWRGAPPVIASQLGADSTLIGAAISAGVSRPGSALRLAHGLRSGVAA